MIRKGLFFSLLFLLFLAAAGQQPGQRNIDWTGVQEIRLTDRYILHQLYFDGAIYTDSMPDVPFYAERVPYGGTAGSVPGIRIVNPVFERMEDDVSKVRGIDKISRDIEVQAVFSYDRREPYIIFTFVPLRRNPATGSVEKLVSFSFEMDEGRSTVSSPGLSRSYAASSVLSTGSWYKIGVSESGIHRVTYEDLQNIGLDPGSVDPRNVRIYGNGGGMLPESLSQQRHDDLQENAIFVAGEEDGRFDPDDYILFYGESPHEWKYNAQGGYFYHAYNIYDDRTYYFITADLGPGKRVLSQPGSTQPVSNTVTKFTDYRFHEIDRLNLAGTGRVWYGEVFDIQTRQMFSFNFPNIDQGSAGFFRAYVAAKSTVSS